MKIGLFDKGLSIRLDPTLIGVDESVVFTNVDNTSGLLVPAKNYTKTSTSVRAWFYLFNTIWYDSNLERDYVEYKSKLYFTEFSSNAKKVIGDVVKLLGIAAPVSKLTTVQGSAGAIDSEATLVQYMYTYYDSSEGVESAPSPMSDELSLAASKQVDLSGFIPSSNGSVDKIRLYRIGADATDFTLIVELPSSTATYSDNIPTLSAVGTILDTYDNQAPLSGLKFLCQAYGIMFAALGSKVYYTKIGEPDAWPSLNFINASNDVTGIFPIQDGVLIFTRKSMILLTGNSPTTFAITPTLATEHGCNSHKSCKIVKNTPVWSSDDGLCAYQGGGVNVVTKDKLGKVSFNIVNVAVYDETYFACLSDGSLFAMDLRFGLCFKEYDFASDITDLGVFDNVLYCIVDGKVTTLFTGELIAMSYRSGDLTEGDSSVIKLYNNVYVKASGTLTLDVYVDGVLVVTHNITTSDIHDLTVPEDKQRGSSIQFNVSGVGVVKEIEYKVVGRQNGR